MCIPFDELAAIGNLLVGVAAIAALFMGKRALKDYWHIKKSNAASEALSKFRCCTDEIIDIVRRKELYQYPSFPQEISTDKKESPHPERPPRLIEMKIMQLKKELHNPISQFSGKEAIDLLQLVSRLQKYYSQFTSALYLTLKSNDGDQTAREQLKTVQHFLDGCEESLNKLNTEAEKILVPIIEVIKKNRWVSFFKK